MSPKDTGEAGLTELPKFRSEVAAAGFEPGQVHPVASPSLMVG